MSDVHFLTPRPDPQPEVIALLDDTMAAAQAGQIRAIALVCLTEDGRCQSRWTGNSTELLGGVQLLNGNLLQEFFGPQEPSCP